METILTIIEYVGISLFVFIIAIIVLGLVFLVLNIFATAKWMAEDLARQVRQVKK